jgi:hypothetical protein
MMICKPFLSASRCPSRDPLEALVIWAFCHFDGLAFRFLIAVICLEEVSVNITQVHEFHIGRF